MPKSTKNSRKKALKTLLK